mmetsp:Transcript_53998/g.107495  ORF Transcript_53998/g.107495 Transcript_53998/m.107495 type:complete len:85 (+) Transcript_53998:39-293(+)
MICFHEDDVLLVVPVCLTAKSVMLECSVCTSGKRAQGCPGPSAGPPSLGRPPALRAAGPWLEERRNQAPGAQAVVLVIRGQSKR